MTCCPPMFMVASGEAQCLCGSVVPIGPWWAPVSCVRCRAMIWTRPVINGAFLAHAQETHGIPRDISEHNIGAQLDRMRSQQLQEAST